jgi:BRCA1-associated protein
MAASNADGSSHENIAPDRSIIRGGLTALPTGLPTKGRFEPLDPSEEELGWGIVRLYRDADETPGLYDISSSAKAPKHNKSHYAGKMGVQKDEKAVFRDEDCTTLCILAVPSYLTPADFLGFVGERTREEVSHFRMIRTERSNRYMVLMKFRNGRKAREWRKEWNGKVFNDVEVCCLPCPPLSPFDVPIS